MAEQAVVTLRALNCIKESDRAGSSHSEPYVWPFMIALSNNSLVATPTSALLFESRKLIKSEMRAGQSAALEGPSNRLAVTFQNEQTNRKLLLVVALLEQDDTPLTVMQAGYQAYLDELRRSIGLALPALLDASATNNSALLEATTGGIRDAVRDKVTAAIRNALSRVQKAQVYFGTLNMDDFMASAFHFVDNLAPGPFTLRLSGPTSGDPKVVPLGPPGSFPATYVSVRFPIDYTLDCTLEVNPLPIDPCLLQRDAVSESANALKGLHLVRQALEGQRATLTEQIFTLDRELIPAGERALLRAHEGLRACVLDPMKK
jgi:hypothetical protein